MASHTRTSAVPQWRRASESTALARLCRIPAWETKGIKVTRVLSVRGEGYVQDVYAKDEPPANPARTCALLCGQKEMAEQLRELLGAQGVLMDNCLTNF
jgi:NAD(P)H-flavin reductase